MIQKAADTLVAAGKTFYDETVSEVTAAVEQAEGADGGTGDSSTASLLKKLNLKGLLSKAPAKA